MKLSDTIRVAALTFAAITAAQAQPRPAQPLPDVSQTSPGAPHRTRLILKDGTYQIVMSYTVKGKIVSYVSAERGETEDLPAELVDWNATHKWERDHSPRDEANGEASQREAPAIDPELLKEEADRRALTPEVAPDLNLPEQDGVVALDYFQGTPELVPLVQTDGELNHTTGHNILKLAINPRAAQHQIVELKGEESAVQMHVAQPVIYIRVGDDNIAPRAGTPLTVDTHGASASAAAKSTPANGSPDSGYVMVRADIRTNARVLASFSHRPAQQLHHASAGRCRNFAGAAARRPLDEGHANTPARLRRVCADGDTLRARDEYGRLGLRRPPRRPGKPRRDEAPAQASGNAAPPQLEAVRRIGCPMFDDEAVEPGAPAVGVTSY